MTSDIPSPLTLSWPGVDITTVKELLGHKTLTMTLRYAHLAPFHKVKAVDMLDEVIKGKQTIK
jgi:integrase